MIKTLVNCVLLLSTTVVFALSSGCCSFTHTCCVEGRVVSKPERWRSYYDFYLDTGRERKKISIKGSHQSPYNTLIDEGRYVMISGVDKRALDRYVIELEEQDIDISISLLK